MRNSFLVKKLDNRDIYTVSEILSFMDGLEQFNIMGSNSKLLQDNFYNMHLDETNGLFVGKELCSTVKISVEFSSKASGYVVTIPEQATIMDWYIGIQIVSLLARDNDGVILSSYGDVYNADEIGTFDFIEEINEFLADLECGRADFSLLSESLGNLDFTKEILDDLANYGRNKAIYYSIFCIKEKNLKRAC